MLRNNRTNARAAARMPRPRLVCTGRSYGPVFPAPPL